MLARKAGASYAGGKEGGMSVGCVGSYLTRPESHNTFAGVTHRTHLAEDDGRKASFTPATTPLYENISIHTLLKIMRERERIISPYARNRRDERTVQHWLDGKAEHPEGEPPIRMQ